MTVKEYIDSVEVPEFVCNDLWRFENPHEIRPFTLEEVMGELLLVFNYAEKVLKQGGFSFKRDYIPGWCWDGLRHGVMAGAYRHHKRGPKPLRAHHKGLPRIGCFFGAWAVGCWVDYHFTKLREEGS